MANQPVQIHVETRPTRRIASVFFHACFWTMLVGSIAISRNYLGGSFLVEMIAAVFSLAMLVQSARSISGREITMSVRDVDRWIADGSPTDVKEWLAANKGRVIPGEEKVSL